MKFLITLPYPFWYCLDYPLAPIAAVISSHTFFVPPIQNGELLHGHGRQVIYANRKATALAVTVADLMRSRMI
ncbi:MULTISPECIES: hypothetical protein [Paraburkholderia]|uniref:hypothetical protein n=1 Tax=Paraburkholderia TaxID=1822464 RepID=UPI00117D8B1D